jgi:hypothetical protein
MSKSLRGNTTFIIPFELTSALADFNYVMIIIAPSFAVLNWHTPVDRMLGVEATYCAIECTIWHSQHWVPITSLISPLTPRHYMSLFGCLEEIAPNAGSTYWIRLCILQRPNLAFLLLLYQGCKRDIGVQDLDLWLPTRDETETRPSKNFPRPWI